MALAKERSISHESFMMSSTISHANNNISPQSPYSPEEFEKQPGNNENNSIAPDDHHGQSVINFTTFLANSDHSLLSFDHKEDYYASTDSDQSYHWPNHSRFSPEFCAFQSASDNYGSNIANCGSQNGWLYSDSTLTAEQSFEESEISQQSGGFNKRPNGEIAMQTAKKQCVSGNSSNNSKKAKVQKPISTSSKDPQSIAAKNRRERISERLKVLQELVPNGSKVDLVTMLEKAISYVKFLQLQVKVLATDEFWPVQGGKAPDISQVREAIDAILSSSQKDRTSSSK